MKSLRPLLVLADSPTSGRFPGFERALERCPTRRYVQQVDCKHSLVCDCSFDTLDALFNRAIANNTTVATSVVPRLWSQLDYPSGIRQAVVLQSHAHQHSSCKKACRLLLNKAKAGRASFRAVIVGEECLPVEEIQ